jgi:hypothetical protein
MNEGRKIISVSRRTDIPAFYTDWLLNRLQDGFAEYAHPFTGQRFTLSLRPENVSGLVFWSKNFAPLLPHLPIIASQYHFYCHLTITGLPKRIEPNVPPPEETLHQAQTIASLFSPHHLQWRFDPLFLDNEVTAEDTIRRFSTLAQALEGSTHRCYTSFVSPYSKVLSRLKQANSTLHQPPLGQKQEIMSKMAEIAAQHGIGLYSCCGDDLVTKTGSWPATCDLRGAISQASSPKPQVSKAHCVDPEILAAIGAPLPSLDRLPSTTLGVNGTVSKVEPSDLRLAPTRKQCGCFKSFDIGAYNTCPHLCLYCYANSNPTRVRQNRSRHNPSRPAL